ncbi:MAG: hypothetical protein ABIJ04_09930 [Bacteroidota bacterium]
MEEQGLLKRIIGEIQSYFTWVRQTRKALGVSVILLCMLPVYVFYVTVIFPVRRCGCDFPPADSVRIEAPAIDPDTNQDALEQVKVIRSLELESAYLESLLTLSQQDSSYLNLDLADSLLVIMIKGVPVRSCSLSEIRVSRQLRCLDQAQRVLWIAAPFLAERDMSTIPKIRYINKQAPKDTIEAAMQSDAPIPSDTSSVYFTIYFNRYLVVEINQVEEPYDVEKRVINRYRREKQQTIRRETWQAFLHLTTPEPEIRIRLTLSKDDARAIYRGIPVHPGLALKLH